MASPTPSVIDTTREPNALLLQWLTQKENIDVQAVQHHRKVLCALLSSEAIAPVLPQLSSCLAANILKDPPRYEKLLRKLMHCSAEFLFDHTLCDLFLTLLSCDDYRIIPDMQALRSLHQYTLQSPAQNSSSGQRLRQWIQEKLPEDARVRHETHELPSSRGSATQIRAMQHHTPYASYEGAAQGPSSQRRDLPEVADLTQASDLAHLHGIVRGRTIPDKHCGAHLRTQYELLRADALHSLFEDVRFIQTAARHLRQQCGWNFTNPQLYHLARRNKGHPLPVFFDVECHGPSVDPHRGMFYVFRFSRPQRHASEKSFMVGNLVLCSADYFALDKPIYVGVVQPLYAQRPGYRGGMHTFGVRFFPTPDFSHDTAFAAHWRSVGVKWTFVESSVYFKPYHTAMARLRELGHQLPLQGAILQGDTCTAPTYIASSPKMCMKGCVKVRGECDTFNVLDYNAWEAECLDWSAAAEREVSQSALKDRCHVLDSTQRKALHHIFTHRLAAVQGTPGTGKTFVGTKFVQLLLENSDARSNRPILCMALTNHAADAFLEDILGMAGHLLGFHGAVVRLGGGSKVEGLKRFKFSSCRPSYTAREVSNDVQMSIKESRTCANYFFHFPLLQRIACEIERMLKAHMIALIVEHHHVAVEHTEPDHPLVQAIQAAERIVPLKPTEQWFHEVLASAKRLAVSEEVKDSDMGKTRVSLLEALEEASSQCGTRRTYWMHVRTARSDIAALQRLSSQWCYHQWVWPSKAYWREGSFVISAAALYPVLKSKNPTQLPKPLPNDIAQMIRTEFNLEQQTAAQPADLKGRGAAVCTKATARPNLSQMPKEKESAIEAELTQEELHRRTNAEDEMDRQELMEVNTFEVFNEEKLRQSQEFVDMNVMEMTTADFLALPEESKQLIDYAARLLYRQENIQEAVRVAESPSTELTIQNSEREVIQDNGLRLGRARLIVGTADSVMTNLASLHLARPRVLVVEEAAEVLESYVLSSMSDELDHLVLIGDHKQLSPKVNEYELEQTKGLSVSLQERLVLCGAPFVTLTMQRRMHPEISRFVHPYYWRDSEPGDQPVYIEDHPRTALIEQPLCVGTITRLCRAFFIGYEAKAGVREERREAFSDSPFNVYEVEVCAAIVHHLHRYYPHKSIVVLVPYTSQLLKLRVRLGDVCSERVSCRTIDDFQGEEADFVVFSVVRTGVAGFLTRENRCCVALSRARMGCYVVGCTRIVRQANSILKHFLQLMEAEGTIGPFFPALCPLHGHAFVFSTLDELQPRSCEEVCRVRLEPCGHECGRSCHGVSHDGFQCQQPCGRKGSACDPPRACEHPCTGFCSAKCGACEARIAYVCPACGDTSHQKCCDTVEPERSIQCQAPFRIAAEDSFCGHWLQATCSDRRSWPSNRKELSKRYCHAVCGKEMPCGHPCPRKCHAHDDAAHRKPPTRCAVMVSLPHPQCGHTVSVACALRDKKAFPACHERCGHHKEETGCRCLLRCTHSGVPCNCGDTHQTRCPDCETVFAAPCYTFTEDAATTHQRKRQCCPACAAPANEAAPTEAPLVKTTVAHAEAASVAELSGAKETCGITFTEAQQWSCFFTCGHATGGCLGNHMMDQCSAPSRRCPKPCRWRCPHQQCPAPCGQRCTRPVCDERCTKALACGHQCYGLCGEECPTFCPACYRLKPHSSTERKQKTTQQKKASRIFCDGWVLRSEDKEDFCGDRLACPPSLQAVDLRLLELPCCGGFTVVGFLERSVRWWMSTTAMGPSHTRVGIPCCPLCLHPLNADAFRRRGRVIREAQDGLIRCRVRQDSLQSRLVASSVTRMNHLWGELIPLEMQTRVERIAREVSRSKMELSCYSALRQLQLLRHPRIWSSLLEWVTAHQDSMPNCTPAILHWCSSATLSHGATPIVAEACLRTLEVPRQHALVSEISQCCQTHMEQYTSALCADACESVTLARPFALMIEWLSCVCSVAARPPTDPAHEQIFHRVMAAHRAVFPSSDTQRSSSSLAPPPEELRRTLSSWDPPVQLEELVAEVGRPAMRELATSFRRPMNTMLHAAEVEAHGGETASWCFCATTHEFEVVHRGGQCLGCGATPSADASPARDFFAL